MVGREHRDSGRWLGTNVRARREALGMAQAYLAAQMKEAGYPWHQATVYNVETGGRAVEMHEGHALAGILETSARALMEPPEQARRRWTIQSHTEAVEQGCDHVYDAAYALGERRVVLEQSLTHHDPQDDPEQVAWARGVLSRRTASAAVAEAEGNLAADTAAGEADAQRYAAMDAAAEQVVDVDDEQG